MRYQQGAITLLITALLLVAILVLSLASYKNVFFQAKRAQNEVISRKQHWAAEGGLECAYSLAVLNPEHIDPRPIPSSAVIPPATIPDILGYEECGSIGPIMTTNTLSSQDGLTIITATEANTSVKKIIKMPKAQGQAAITANADFMLYGSFNIRPNPIGPSTGSTYECLAVKYSQKFFFKKNVPGSKLEQWPPYNTQTPPDPLVPTLICNSAYQTNLSDDSELDEENDDSTTTEVSFKKDFVYDDQLDPFKNLFGVTYDYKNEVKALFTLAEHSGTCEDKIKTALNSGSELIWIEGNCDLSAGSAVTSSADDGIIVVIENGLLSINGVMPFKGIIYQLIRDPLEPNWSGLSVEDQITPRVADGTFPKNPTAYIFGSAIPEGAVIIDTPDQLAVIYGSANISFNKEKIDHPLKKLLKPKWLKGSWHDF